MWEHTTKNRERYTQEEIRQNGHTWGTQHNTQNTHSEEQNLTDETGETKLNITHMKQTIKIKREETHSLRPTLRHANLT